MKRKWTKSQRYSRPRRDHNHKTLERAYVILGCLAMDTSMVGGGFPDIVVYDPISKTLHMSEVKNPNTSYGRAGLSTIQKYMERLGWPIELVWTTEDVAAQVKKWRD